MLHGKKILLGVSASIAAYKSAFLIRLLVKEGADVKVIMTPASKEFITPLTLSTLSKHPVLSEFVASAAGEWNNHVELGLWADMMVIAPASANTIAKMAGGACDNLLMAAYLSARCPVYVAPAMDLDMFAHPSTTANLKKIVSYGNKIIQPGDGELASGLHGVGRMAEPEEIVGFLQADLKKKLPLSGKKALVTAGPTYEAIDPVRFIGNHSSGKMGFALAEELAAQGAEVTLVCGPNALQTSNTSIKRIDVTSAAEMHRATTAVFSKADITVMAAAVADYRPAKAAKEKIKKGQGVPGIGLVPTHDILLELGKKKTRKQYLVGFALETSNGLANAKEKLRKKNLDLIVLNSLEDKGAGFKTGTNKVTLIDRNNKTIKFELKQKQLVAKDIVLEIVKRIKNA